MSTLHPGPAIRTDEYCAGWHAYRAGAPVTGNPHTDTPVFTFAHWYDWRAGWHDSERENTR